MSLSATMQSAPAKKLISFKQQIACETTGNNSSRNTWAIAQLHLRPYQHILEIGFGTGHTLLETARKLQVGFIAATESSIEDYQLAYKRTKKYVQQQMLQLHLGKLEDLPYPAYYFDTAYSNNNTILHEHADENLLRIHRMLKIGGKLVMVFQSPRSWSAANLSDAKFSLKARFEKAGFTRINIAGRDMYPSGCISITGYK